MNTTFYVSFILKYYVLAYYRYYISFYLFSSESEHFHYVSRLIYNMTQGHVYPSRLGRISIPYSVSKHITVSVKYNHPRKYSYCNDAIAQRTINENKMLFEYVIVLSEQVSKEFRLNY